MQRFDRNLLSIVGDILDNPSGFKVNDLFIYVPFQLEYSFAT